MPYIFNSTLERKTPLRNRKRMRRSGSLKRSQMIRGRKPLNKVGRHGKRDSPKLIKWRKEVRERDDYTCQYPSCDRRSKRIDVHHIAKRTARPDLKFTVSNGICLCREHHDWTDTNLQEALAIGLRNTESYELAKKQEREAA